MNTAHHCLYCTLNYIICILFKNFYCVNFCSSSSKLQRGLKAKIRMEKKRFISFLAVSIEEQVKSRAFNSTEIVVQRKDKNYEQAQLCFYEIKQNFLTSSLSCSSKLQRTFVLGDFTSAPSPPLLFLR